MSDAPTTEDEVLDFEGGDKTTELKKLEVPKDHYDGRFLVAAMVSVTFTEKWVITVSSLTDLIGGLATDSFGIIEVEAEVEDAEAAMKIADAWIRFRSEFVPGFMTLNSLNAFYVIR
jgi:hypothetical protein